MSDPPASYETCVNIYTHHSCYTINWSTKCRVYLNWNKLQLFEIFVHKLDTLCLFSFASTVIETSYLGKMLHATSSSWTLKLIMCASSIQTSPEGTTSIECRPEILLEKTRKRPLIKLKGTVLAFILMVSSSWNNTGQISLTKWINWHIKTLLALDNHKKEGTCVSYKGCFIAMAYRKYSYTAEENWGKNGKALKSLCLTHAVVESIHTLYHHH